MRVDGDNVGLTHCVPVHSHQSGPKDPHNIAQTHLVLALVRYHPIQCMWCTSTYVVTPSTCTVRTYIRLPCCLCRNGGGCLYSIICMYLRTYICSVCADHNKQHRYPHLLRWPSTDLSVTLLTVGSWSMRDCSWYSWLSWSSSSG